MDGFCKLERIQDAKKWFIRMQACGELPDSQSYSILLDGLCKNHQLSGAIALLRGMEGKKLEHDIVIYNILIECLCKAGKVEAKMNVITFQLNDKPIIRPPCSFTIILVYVITLA